MSEWAAKRFWTETRADATEGGYTVYLDARRVSTPAKAAFVLPTLALAEACAAEWDRQVEKIDPGAMPLTRTANSAIDKVAMQRAEVAEMLAAYGDSDLLCYRADAPAELVNRQATHWDPLLEWAHQTLNAPLAPRIGIMHVPQKPEALMRLSERVHALDHFRLAAFHDLVALSGSLVLALAVIQGQIPAETAWDLSRVDEDYQADVWGVDDDAAEQAVIKKQAFLDAALFFRLVDLKA